MPQMKPMNWIILFIITNMFLFLMNMLIYFFKNNNNNYIMKNKNISQKINNWTW